MPRPVQQLDRSWRAWRVTMAMGGTGQLSREGGLWSQRGAAGLGRALTGGLWHHGLALVTPWTCEARPLTPLLPLPFPDRV